MLTKSFKQSIGALRSNPVRTVLTTSGIVMGIATVIIVLSAGEGFRSLINNQIQSLGSNTLFIRTRVPPTTKSRANTITPGLGVGITTFKERDLKDIERLNNVSGAYGMVTGLAVVSYRNNEKSVIYYGSSTERFNIDQHTLKEGRFYTDAENQGASQVVILGKNLANDLFLQDEALGKLIHVGDLNFQVIGVYNSQGALGPQSADDSLFMPLATAQKKMLGIDYISIAIVQLKDEKLSDATVENIRLTLRRNHTISNPDKDDFTVMTQAQILDIYNVIFTGITILLICIASISLVVGGVGIMNIMYVVVTERTSEIGLKKAIGAKNSDILSEFLIESILVTVLGGILGIVIGTLFSWFISVIANSLGLAWTFVVPLYAVVVAVVVSSAIGISFGVLPARNASKLDPIEALRRE